MNYSSPMYLLFPIRSVVMARFNEYIPNVGDIDDDGNPLVYTFYLSCGHFIKLPENIALNGMKHIKTIARCYKCPLNDGESVYIETD
jgi:hypothetical protein